MGGGRRSFVAGKSSVVDGGDGSGVGRCRPGVLKPDFRACREFLIASANCGVGLAFSNLGRSTMSLLVMVGGVGGSPEFSLVR